METIQGFDPEIMGFSSRARGGPCSYGIIEGRPIRGSVIGWRTKPSKFSTYPCIAC